MHPFAPAKNGTLFPTNRNVNFQLSRQPRDMDHVARILVPIYFEILSTQAFLKVSTPFEFKKLD
jgi:hypothetical protein